MKPSSPKSSRNALIVNDEEQIHEQSIAPESDKSPRRFLKATDARPKFSPLALNDRVVIKLVYEELITLDHVEQAWIQWIALPEDARSPLWRFLLLDKTLDRETILEQAAAAYDFLPLKLTRVEVVNYLKEFGESFSEEQWHSMARQNTLPVGFRTPGKSGIRSVIFATPDPTDPNVRRLLESFDVKQFELRYAPESFIVALIEDRFRLSTKLLDQELTFDFDLSNDFKEGTVDDDALDAEINRSALIQLFESILVEAVRQGASDVHVVPDVKRHIEISLRIDGALRFWHSEERVHPEAFLAVVKDNTISVDRFVRDRAQDGFIQRTIDGSLIRFRVSVIPIINARMDLRSESIVIRVLDDRKIMNDLDDLGLDGSALRHFEWALDQPYGMVVLTGPTGSGKSTTLNAALQHISSPERNTISVEDPVEYVLAGVRQVKLGDHLTFNEALRAILRHDPDVVMVGEMRDRVTAELAIKLANTGHLAFSTLHTNDAPSAISRLYKMGIEPFLIAYAVNLIVAQRLMRILCPTCKMIDEKTDPILLERLGFAKKVINSGVFYAPGCDENCPGCLGTGYHGRRAIAEVLAFSPEIRRMIVSANEIIDEEALRNQAIKEGMVSQQEAARELVQMGETSVQEMMRVVFTSL